MHSHGMNAVADKQKYNAVIAKFNSFCASYVNVVAMTHKPLTMKQEQMNTDKYVTVLHNVT